VKPEEFEKRKRKYEERAKVQISDEEFRKLLARQRTMGIIIMFICLIAGLAMAADWPGRWIAPFGDFSSYLGWVVVVISAISLIRDFVTKI
jgi:hypothetical protein